VILALVMLGAGLSLLLGAGALLVHAASRLALLLGLSPLLIGATVVAFGTSMPELFVSVAGALRGLPGIAAGNVIGSNIANVLLVLGLASVIAPLTVHRRLLRMDIPVLLVVTGYVLLIGADGRISRLEGAAGVIALLVFSVVQVRWFAASEGIKPSDATLPAAGQRPRLPVEAGVILLAIAGLALGSTLFVQGASELAERAGAGEFAIGATVVAVGTSLPEVVTSVIAALKRQHDIAVANVVGSNLFNALGVLGASALATPLTLDRGLYSFELPVLALTALVLLPLAWPRFRIGRIEGALLLAGFVAFTVLTLVRGA
jgi:cation:H+ antiporter